MNETIVDLLVERLEQAEQQLSDEAYEFLNSFEDIDDIITYQNALLEYKHIIKDRFFMDEEDERDELLIKNMLLLINTLINAMIEMDDKIVVIDIDD